MKVWRTLRYAAPPDVVCDMLIAADFQSRIAAAIEAPECSIVAEPNKVTTIMLIPTAESLGEVAGAYSRQTGVLEWLTPLQNGRREGRLAVQIDRFPVHFSSRIWVTFADGVTQVNYDADLNFDIPVLERSNAQAVADRTSNIIGLNQRLGEQWLRDIGIAHPEV